MSKYKSKQQLLDEISKEKHVLDKVLESVDRTKLCLAGACVDWSIKDLICHLAEWQEMVLSWYETGLAGKSPEVPGKGYKWSQLPELNKEIYKKYKNITWEEAQQFFQKSEAKIMIVIAKLEEETLLKPALYPWMKQNTLIAYFGSCTSSHYKWATGIIKKFVKNDFKVIK
jgi:hypothetical protein